MGALAVFERIRVCHQVPAHAERVDELLHTGDLADAVCGVDVDVGSPVDGVIRNAKSREDVFVEAVAPDETLVDLLEEFAGSRTLDDAVVVGARQGDRLADGEFCEGLQARALELSRVLERSRTHNRPRATHESGNRMFGADSTGVREGDRISGIVGGGEFVRATACDDILVGDEEVAKSHGVCALDAGHHE